MVIWLDRYEYMYMAIMHSHHSIIARLYLFLSGTVFREKVSSHRPFLFGNGQSSQAAVLLGKFISPIPDREVLKEKRATLLAVAASIALTPLSE
jgi:hypothetical protein